MTAQNPWREEDDKSRMLRSTKIRKPMATYMKGEAHERQTYMDGGDDLIGILFLHLDCKT